MPYAGADDWAIPGVPRPVPAQPELQDDVAALAAAVERALAVDPADLPGPAALARAEQLLRLQERLGAVALRAVADVDARDLWSFAAAGSTRTWLRTLPCGDTGQLAAARAVTGLPLLHESYAAGRVSRRTAGAVARHLARVPADVDPAQLRGVLVDGVGDLLAVWAGAACLEPTAEQHAEYEGRRDRLARAVSEGLASTWSGPAAQLEPAFVLAAEVLPPAELDAGLGLLVDALQPEAERDAAAEEAYRSRDLTLRKLSRGGWSLRAHLTDETGQLLADELLARRTRHALEQPDESRAPAVDGGPADFGQVGPGTPVGTSGREVEGTPLPSSGQRDHDAFAALLADLTAVAPGSGTPAPASLTITASLRALQGEPGATPAELHTRGPRPVPLAPSTLRRHACRSRLASVLLDPQHHPVSSSDAHRDATERERRVMRALWGTGCAVNGCVLRGTVPHHVVPFWISGRTRQPDLAPLCEHHHHDVHEGSKTLRLRDGRLLDERGWADAAWSRAS